MHMYAFTIILCMYTLDHTHRASKAKVLRLEKEARELEKTMEALRQSQAKAAELEKTNKKLYAQTHTDRKEIIKLREVSREGGREGEEGRGGGRDVCVGGMYTC